ncbi:MAG: hypothetical protein RLZZ420_1604 [Bacteroidota bacterium]|jgi:hypothetical protein
MRYQHAEVPFDKMGLQHVETMLSILFYKIIFDIFKNNSATPCGERHTQCT